MKFIESKPKSLIYTILLFIFASFEMGVLSSYRFATIGSANDRCLGMTMEKTETLAKVGSSVGWNFVVWSVLLILLIWGFAMLLGYNRNYGGLIAIGIVNVIPLIGLFGSFDFWIGYGYSIYAPAMAIFGMTHCTTTGQQIANNIIFAAIVVIIACACWFIGFKIRAAYAKKYEYDD